MECTFSNQKLNIAMPLDIMDDIVRAYLRDQVLRFETDIKQLISIHDLESHQKQDLIDWVEYRDAHLKVLEYVSEHLEHEAWMQRNDLGSYILDF